MAIWLLDPGHGGRDLGVVYNENIEKNDNLKIALKVGEILRDKGEEVYFTRIDDTYLSLSDRITIGNKKDYDYLVSFHRNSFSPENNNGVEIFYYNDSLEVKSICNSLKDNLSELFEFRGINKGKIFLLKKVNTNGILIELGFIDNTLDNEIFNSRIDEIATIIGNSLVPEIYNEDYKNNMWRVCVGEFEGYMEAEKLMKEFRNLGYEACVIPLKE